MRFSFIAAIFVLLVSMAGAQAASYYAVDLGNGAAYGINDSTQIVGTFGLWQNGHVRAVGAGSGLAINNSGEIVGYSYLWGYTTSAAEWIGGDIFSLGQGVAYGLNSSGAIVGQSQNNACLWQNGTITMLGGLPKSPWGGTATGINSQGQIVGYSPRYSLDYDLKYDACLWTNGLLTDLGWLPGLTGSYAYGINDSGDIVGYAGVTNSAAIEWHSDGSYSVLDPVPGQEGAGSTALAINNSGQIVGCSGSEACLWDNGTVTDLGPGKAYAINSKGQIVGSSTAGRALLWQTQIDKITDAKKLVDGNPVSFSEKVVTSAAGDFANYFYIEEPSRFSGIRVLLSPSSIVGLDRGSVVNVTGTMSTTSSGERQIIYATVTMSSTTGPTPISMGISPRNLGGANLGVPPAGQYGITGGSGANNVGLLVRTWGTVTSRGTGYVMVSDGGGTVKVSTSTLSSQPAIGSYIQVTGMSSLTGTSTNRQSMVLPRGDGDVHTF